MRGLFSSVRGRTFRCSSLCPSQHVSHKTLHTHTHCRKLMVIATPNSHFHIQRLKYHLPGQSGGRNRLEQIYLMSWNGFKTPPPPPRLPNFPSSVLGSRTSESSGHDSQLHSDRLCPAHTSLSARRADKHCTPTGKHFSFCTLIIGKVSFWKLLIFKTPLKQYFFTSTEWTLLRPVFGKHNILCKQSASEGHNPLEVRTFSLSEFWF